MSSESRNCDSGGKERSTNEQANAIATHESRFLNIGVTGLFWNIVSKI
jgi:hypothetical protein